MTVYFISKILFTQICLKIMELSVFRILCFSFAPFLVCLFCAPADSP